MQPIAKTPIIVKEAMSSSDKPKWKSAMDIEIKSLKDNNI